MFNMFVLAVRVPSDLPTPHFLLRTTFKVLMPFKSKSLELPESFPTKPPKRAKIIGSEWGNTSSALWNDLNWVGFQGTITNPKFLFSASVFYLQIGISVLTCFWSLTRLQSLKKKKNQKHKHWSQRKSTGTRSLLSCWFPLTGANLFRGSITSNKNTINTSK